MKTSLTITLVLSIVLNLALGIVAVTSYQKASRLSVYSEQVLDLAKDNHKKAQGQEEKVYKCAEQYRALEKQLEECQNQLQHD